MARTLINVPASAARGTVIEIKTLIAHPMESGFRPGPNGQLLPRDIITRFICTFEGDPVFSADLAQAVAANPFIAFTTVAAANGTFRFTWEGDNGFAQTETASITVT